MNQKYARFWAHWSDGKRKNIYVDKELTKSDTMTKFGNSEFAIKHTNYYNLDMIISLWI